MWSYRLIFHKPLVVVLSVEEVKPGETFASVDGAARSLARICRPVIDASNNSLPEPSKATMRERVLVVDDMSRTVLNSMPTLQKLLSVLKKYELGDLTWAVIGGVPANYLHLVDALEEVGESKERDVVFGFVRLALVRAIATRVDAPANRALYEFFKERNLAKLPVPYDKPASMGLARPTPDKVLRVVYLPNKDAVLAPATPAMAVVLYHYLQAATLPETAEALKALLGLPEKDEAPVASTL